MIKCRRGLLCLLLMVTANLFAASITLFPADLRQDKTVYCIGNEVNPVHFIIFADRACGGKPGRYLIKDFNKDIDTSTVSLSVDVPDAVKCLGLVDMKDDDFDPETKIEKIKVNGIGYTRYTIPLKHEIIISRVVKGRHRYDINLWLDLPEQYQGELNWRLLKNNKVIVAAINRVKTVGTLAGMSGRPSPDFKFFLTYPEPNLPSGIIDRRIALYKKMGVTDVTFNYSDAEFPEKRITFINKLRAAGIKIALQRSGSFSSERRSMRNTSSGKNPQGLYSAANQCYADITGDRNKDMLSSLKGYMDSFALDYEHHGAVAHPAYNDKETVAAFAKAAGLENIPTTEELKGNYYTKYIEFRDRLIMKPIYAVASLVNDVKPGTPFFMEQGSGMPIGSKLNYKIYDDVVSYHLPMIYTNPLDFYHRVGLMVDYVGKERVIPVTCAGFTDSNNKILLRSQPGGLLLDYIGAASHGVAGVKHWPGAFYLDGGQLYDFCRGADLLDKVGSFYTHGKPTDSVKANGIPYMVKEIKLPGKTLDMSQPQWKNYLMSTVMQKGNEVLVSILNYHSSEDAYVKISWKQVGKMYLREAQSGKHLSVNGSIALSGSVDSDGVMIKVPAMNPGLWVLSQNKPTDSDKTIVGEDIVKAFEKRKELFNRSKSVIQIGTKGKITVGYKNVESCMGDEACLMVSTPSQSICIKNAGGIIWKWEMNGKDLVLREDVNDGVAMDLLWMPETARWKGDEKNEMRLLKCENNGKIVTLIYEQKLKSSLANIVLRKTYRIPADKSLVKVGIELINKTEQPLEMSYWSHNIFGNVVPESRLFMIAKENSVETVAYGAKKSSVYSNNRNATEYSEHLIKKARANFSGNVFGEYFKDDKNGVILTVPSDFMQIYRWVGKEKGSLEWMGIPRKIATGDSYITEYTIHAVAADDQSEFKKELAQIASLKSSHSDKQATSSNDTEPLVMPLDFTFNGSDSMPDGYSTYHNYNDGVISRDDKLFAGTIGPSLRLYNAEKGRIAITTGKDKRLNLDRDKKYILTFQFKIKDMTTFGKWPCGFVFYLLGASKNYVWIGASGNGSSDGWITAIMPFDTGKKPAMAKPYIRILCNNISGTVWMQNLSISEVTEETMPQGRYFILDNGMHMDGSIFKL